MAAVTIVVLVINVLSRAMALVSNSKVTAAFGATALTSAYSFAITFAGIITTVIGTTLTTSVIPIYTELRAGGDKKRTDSFINNTISLTVIVSFVLIAAGYFLAPIIAKIAAKGDFGFSVYSIRVLMVSVLFMCMYYIFSGLLQANDRFFLSAAVSIPSSMITMGYIMFMSQKYELKGLVVATLIGFFAQAAILVPALGKTNVRFAPSFKYNNPDMKRIFSVVAPVIVGICAYQVNILTNSTIAFRYDAENYIVLNNAQNLGIQIVLTMVLAISSVIYPKLSDMEAQGRKKEFGECLTFSLCGVILLLVPLTFGFYMCGTRFIDIIYGYGKFTEENVALGGSVFALYALGILGIGFKEITDRAFYAKKITGISAFNGLFIMIVNIALSIVLVRFYGLKGIALAYSVAAFAGGVNIVWQFRRKFSDVKIKSLIIAFAKAMIASVVMAGVLYLTKDLAFGASKISSVIALGVSAGAGVMVYAVMLLLLKTEEIYKFINLRRDTK